MTDKSTAAVRELVERWMGKKHPITMRSYVSDLTALIEEHYVKKEEHEKLVNAALQNKPQPTAEGAEEIEAELRGYARDIVRLHKPIMEVNPQLAMDSIGNDLVKMFNRLAQRLAEKMVEEKKCYYCNGDGQVVQDYEHGEIGKCTICNGTGKIRK